MAYMAYFSNESRVLAKPFAFEEDYAPSRITGRTEELSSLGKYLEPATEGLKPPHIWVSGPSGSGKTSLVESELSRLRQDQGLGWLRIDCWVDPTVYLALDRICRDLRILRAEQQSVSFKLQRLREHWGKIPFVLVLDEIDMMAPKERAALLYTLANVRKVGVVAIAYNRKSLAELDTRVRSRLNPRILHLKPYSTREVVAILDGRAAEGLQPDTWNRDVLHRIARLSGKDARLAIKTLGDAARNAERGGAAQVEDEHIKEAWTGLTELKTQKKLQDLTQHHRILHDMVNQAQEITSKDLWRSYREQCKDRKLKPISPRTFLVYLNRLVRLRLIEEEHVIDRGRVRVLRSLANPKT